jgi:signal transduction histidine kinase
VKPTYEELQQRIADLELENAKIKALAKKKELLLTSNSRLKKDLHEIEEQQQLLIQKSRLDSLGELSSGLAHEISQPLSVISLVMENIRYKMDQNQVSPEYLVVKFGTISQNINKIKAVIDHVRIFSREQRSIVIEKVNVNQVISSALSMVESQLKEKHINFYTELNEEIGNTLGNPSRFEQAILNLLSNSRDALLEKEKKIISGNPAKEIHIATSREDDRILVRIRDTGTGIPSKDVDKIFNPFFSTKTDERGTGLGLPIVYGIITEMKGKISVITKQGEFTEMTISLPHYK